MDSEITNIYYSIITVQMGTRVISCLILFINIGYHHRIYGESYVLRGLFRNPLTSYSSNIKIAVGTYGQPGVLASSIVAMASTPCIQSSGDGEADAPAASLQASEVWMLPPYLPFPFPFSILQSNHCFNDLG